MARKRMIDPSFWTDEKLGMVSPYARLLFMGLISQADDEGRLSGHPALIRSLIFPYDAEITVDQIEDWLETLDEKGLIQRYVVGDQKYIFVKNFAKHQTINRKQPSKLPPPPFTDCSVNDNERVNNDTLTIQSQKKRKEEKRKEEKGREENVSQTILEKVNEIGLQCKGVWELDQLCSYVGLVDLDVVLEAIRRAEHKKRADYALGILKNWVAEGIKTMDDLLPKGGVGNAKPQGNTEGIRSGRDTPTSESESITNGRIGWLAKDRVQHKVSEVP